ncbi:MAG: molybdopterin-dependent oxidoreductase, partial [Alphaproteobacteria bacterium]
MMDHAARQLGIDRVELRRRNFIKPEQMPYTTSLDQVYDSGEFEAEMDKALALAEWDGFADRRAESEKNGKLRGIGIANCIEQSAGGPPEWAQIRFDPSGTVTLIMGTHNHGQGHETIFRQMLSDMLGLEFEQVRMLQG